MHNYPAMGYSKSDNTDRFTEPATRGRVVNLRIDEATYARLRMAAAQESRTLSAFLRIAATERADRTLMVAPRHPPGRPR